MPTKRKPRQRQWHAKFSPEVLSLFLELEHGRQRGEAFRRKEKTLMYALGLVSEFWSMTSVLDRSTGPGCEPQYCRYQDWHTCRRVREQLLAASGTVEAPTTAQ